MKTKLTLFPMISLAMVFASGCEKLDTVEEGAEIVAYPSDLEPVEPLLTPPTASVDEYGNYYKVIVTAHGATLGTPDGPEPVELMDRFYLHDTTDTHYVVSRDARASQPDGKIAINNGVVSSTVMFTRTKVDSLNIRQPVAGYTSIDEIKQAIAGEDVRPSLTEQLLGTNNEKAWMPILGSSDLTAGTSTVRVLELGAWTIAGPRDPAQLNLMDPSTDTYAPAQTRIAIVLDTTASMQPAFETVRDHLYELVRSCFNGNTSGLQMSFFVYRDEDEGSVFALAESGFTSDVQQLEQWIANFSPRAGGDHEEQMFPALEAAVDALVDHPQSFRSILICADAPGKTYGQDPVLGELGREQLERCISEGISVSTLQVNHPRRDERLAMQFSGLTEPTFGTSFSLDDNDAIEIAKQLRNAFFDTVEMIEEETEVAVSLNSGRSLSQIAAEMDLSASALRWHVDNVRRKDLHRRMSVGERDTLGVESVFVAFDSTQLECGILISKEEVRALLTLMDRLLEAGIAKPESIVPLFEAIAGTTIGDPDITISDILRLQGIPVRHGILSISCAELVVMPHQQRQLWAEEIEDRYQRLSEYVMRHNHDANGFYVIPLDIFP